MHQATDWMARCFRHEMSHGFDDDGRQYDARGELKDWWDDATVQVAPQCR